MTTVEPELIVKLVKLDVTIDNYNYVVHGTC